jgi:hypothetical protein
VRLVFTALMFLVGLGLAAYPMLAPNLPHMPIGTWQVYAPVSGFLAFDARLSPDNAPVQVYLDLTSAGVPKFSKDRAVLTLTVSADGKTVLAAPLTFEDAVARDDTPQTPEMIYRASAGVIDPVEARTPDYRFTTGLGDAEGIDIAKVDLVLERGPQGADPRAQPIGFALMAVGFIAFVLSLRGRDGGTPPNPNSQPPPPRWGRRAG